MFINDKIKNKTKDKWAILYHFHVYIYSSLAYFHQYMHRFCDFQGHSMSLKSERKIALESSIAHRFFTIMIK